MFVPRRSLQPTPAGPLGAIKRVDGLPAEGTPPTHRHKSGGFDGRNRVLSARRGSLPKILPPTSTRACRRLAQM